MLVSDHIQVWKLAEFKTGKEKEKHLGGCSLLSAWQEHFDPRHAQFRLNSMLAWFPFLVKSSSPFE